MKWWITKRRRLRPASWPTAPPGPEALAEQTDMIDHIRHILDQELTPKQREALVLLGIQDLPLEEAARRMKTNRNALYKLLHDARLRLKQRLIAEGIESEGSSGSFRTKVRSFSYYGKIRYRLHIKGIA